jgi:hypothetical protein
MITQFLAGAIIPLIIIVKTGILINFAVFMTAFLFLNLIIWQIVRRYLLQPIEIILTEERIYFRYLNYNLSKSKKHISTTFDKILRFSDFSGGRDLKFKLYFTHGQTFTLYKSGLWRRKDDFEVLLYDFHLLIDKLNVNRMNNSHINRKMNLKYGDNTYFSSALISFCGAFFCGLMFIISIFTKNEVPDYKILYGFLILLGLGLLDIYIHKKAKRKM